MRRRRRRRRKRRRLETRKRRRRRRNATRKEEEEEGEEEEEKEKEASSSSSSFFSSSSLKHVAGTFRDSICHAPFFDAFAVCRRRSFGATSVAFFVLAGEAGGTASAETVACSLQLAVSMAACDAEAECCLNRLTQ